MRLLQFIPDAEVRSKVLALAAARGVSAREDPYSPGWIVFEAVIDGRRVDRVLKAAGVQIPA
jgi:hypothetical protein